MTWYKNMDEKQKNDFKKVIAVAIIGIILVLTVPMILKAF